MSELPTSRPGPAGVPAWLGRAWKLRTAMLAAIFGLVAMLIYGRLQLADAQALLEAQSLAGTPTATRAAGGAISHKLMVPLGWLVATALAAGADWLWLQRNHHRVNSWGLSKGRDARNRPS